MTNMPGYAIIIYAGVQKALYLGVAQLVARYLGVVEAARSSRVTQTRKQHAVPGGFLELRVLLFACAFA